MVWHIYLELCKVLRHVFVLSPGGPQQLVKVRPCWCFIIEEFDLIVCLYKNLQLVLGYLFLVQNLNLIVDTSFFLKKLFFQCEIFLIALILICVEYYNIQTPIVAATIFCVRTGVCVYVCVCDLLANTIYGFLCWLCCGLVILYFSDGWMLHA